MPLPIDIDKTSPADTDNPSAGAANIRDLKDFLESVFGLTDATNYTVAPFSITTAGVVTIAVAGAAIQNGTAAAPGLVFTGSTTTGLYRFAANAIGFSCNGVAVASFGASGQYLLTPQALSGTPATTGSYFNIAAATFTDNNTAGSGTAAAFAAYAFQRPTLAATNASVTTTAAATVYIANAPAAGTNQTLTNAYALWADDGLIRFDGIVRLGEASTVTGGIAFCHASSANRTTVQGGNATAAVTYTLPTAAPTVSGQLLAATTAGAMSWAAGSARMAAGSFTAPAGTGNNAVTGLGFQPSLVIFFSTRTDSSGNNQSGSGAATSSSNRWAVAAGSNSTNHYSKTVTTLCIYNINQAGSTEIAADFVSMDSDGFTVNFSTTATIYTVGWIAFG